jgi:hypothetical protein
MPAEGRFEVTLHIFQTLTLGVVELLALCSACFSRGKKPPLPFQCESRRRAPYPVRYFGEEERLLPSGAPKHDCWVLRSFLCLSLPLFTLSFVFSIPPRLIIVIIVIIILHQLWWGVFNFFSDVSGSCS